MQKKVKLFLNYDSKNISHPERVEFTTGYLLSEALKEFFDIVTDPSEADLVFNTVPYNQGQPFIKGKVTFIYDNNSPHTQEADWVYYSSEGKLDIPNSSLLSDATIPSYKYYPSEFECEIGYLGRHHVRERARLIAELEKDFVIQDRELPLGDASARKLSRAKLALIVDDYREMGTPRDWIDRRIYTFGNIRPILVPFNKDYLMIGKPHVHYIPYNDLEDLIIQAKYYLAHMDKAEKIGNNLKKVLLNHTYAHRAREIYKKYLEYV